MVPKGLILFIYVIRVESLCYNKKNRNVEDISLSIFQGPQCDMCTWFFSSPHHHEVLVQVVGDESYSFTNGYFGYHKDRVVVSKVIITW